MSENPTAAAQILYDPVPRMLCPYCRTRMDVTGLEPFTKAICPGCQRQVPVPARLGAFLLLDLLGTGGMGGVYRAHDETLGRDVAIKVMLKSLGDNVEFVQAFRREAQAAAKLNHPNIAQIYSFGQEKGQPYIVMELVPGQHFDQMISSSNPLDPAFVMRIGMDIAEGLQLASQSNLVHGDIKPENILLDERNQAKLVDFGIASTTSQNKGEIWGTPYYIAPEKVRRQRVDYRSDIYCLGGTLYHALAGHPPFDGADAVEVVKARFKGPPAPLEKIRPDVDAEVIAIINRMLQFEPAMRYPTYESLLSDIRHYLNRVAPQGVNVASAGRGKRFVIKGKTRTLNATSSTTSSAVAGMTGGMSSSMTTGGLPSATGRSKTIMVSRGMIPEMPPRADEDSGKSGGSKRVSKMILIPLLALLGIGVLAGGTFLFLRFKKHRETLATEQAHAAALQSALDTVGRHLSRSLAMRRQLGAHVEQGLANATQAVESVELELDEDWSARIMSPDAPVEPKTPTSSEPVASDAATNDVPTVAEARVPVDDQDADVDEALTPSEGEEREEPLDAVAEGAPEDRETEAEPDVAVVAAPPIASPEDLPPLVRMAHEVWLQARPLRQAALRADQVVKHIEQIMAMVKTGTNEQAVLQRQVASAERLEQDLAATLVRAPDWVANTSAKLLLVEQEIERREADREAAAERLRREEEARRAAAEEAARQAALQAAIDNERMRVKGAFDSQLENISQHRYRDALRELLPLEMEMQTEEGRQAWQVAKERIERLLELKDFLVERLAKGDFRSPQGWSVTHATARNVTVRSLSGKEDDVSWERIGVAQIAPFIQFYLLDEHKARELRLLERVRQSINAALYCVIFGEGSAAARDMAENLVTRAVDFLPDAQRDVDRVLPEIAENP